MASAAPPFKAPDHIQPRFLFRSPLLRAPFQDPLPRRYVVRVHGGPPQIQLAVPSEATFNGKQS